MTFRERAENAARTIYDVLQMSPTAEQAKKVGDAVERALIEAALNEQERCAQVAVQCCSADRDMAHKVAVQIRQTHTALIANLSGMR